MKQTATDSTPRRRRIRATSRASSSSSGVEHLAVVADALGHLEPVAAPHVRRRDVGVGVPQVLLRAAPDLDHVAEALRRDHRDGREPARDQRVGGDRGAVREEDGVAQVDARLAHAGHHALHRVGRRRRDLRDADRRGGLVQDADVGEGATDVDRHANRHQTCACSRSISTRRRILPDADFGISSMNSQARMRLYGDTLRGDELDHLVRRHRRRRASAPRRPSGSRRTPRRARRSRRRRRSPGSSAARPPARPAAPGSPCT